MSRAAAVVAVLLLALGCSAGEDGATTSPPAASTTAPGAPTPSPPAVGAAPGPLATAPSSAPSPGPSSGPSPVSELDPFFDAGQDVYLAPDGPQPRELLAEVSVAVTFHNLTGSEVTVEFPNASFLTPLVVPPNGEAAITPDRSVTIAYTATSSPEVRGTVSVAPTAVPGFG